MKKIYKTIFQIFSFTILTIFVMQSIAYCKTEITGTVTSKRADSVKVEFAPHKTAGPKVGDKVDFKTMMQGLEVNAGQGEVTESESSSTWVKINKGHPNLKMTALIHATGKPGPVEYMLELEGKEFQIKGKTKWIPRVVFKFKSVSTLKTDGGWDNIAFPGGAYLESPNRYWSNGVNLQKTHKKGLEFYIKSIRDLDHEVQIVWQNRKVQGLNTAFHLSQIIITRKIPHMSREDWAKFHHGEKYVKRAPTIYRDQEFTASFRIPTPPPDKRIYMEYFYYITFHISDNADEQYRPKYWEKIFLEILKSVTIDII